ncbi:MULTISPECIES: hypothetical protein [Stenotrophomonas]|uniref:hypothetical protein n=1 Tax=Stenotrophomonas TaxID=40323 RepID=UPI000D365B2B|nr:MULTISPECIES: hypothetical protein [Stenotrophomonas]PTS72255.1 hypothetical protein DBR20_19270 [Stenotrophomonas sp. HMWF023]CAH0154683.1 hypothetical protein SRABI122_00789 [Stenotrophomonas lactitubi]CAH0172163.1 hypothetical protein SRABI102_01057 [Stenotrophomonas lactitubi]CAH0183201.1 hypothetical protein SRABI81_01515 [Stenotrophomonas lactitubi]CAH0207339.1 hypothetical protein SRABI66_02095 [Stenotrophomonas lactitubi]
MKKLLLVIVAVLVAIRLIDYIFYGGNAYDLAGAAGFGLLALGIVLEQRAAKQALPTQGTGRRRANIVSACGIALVLVSFMLKWQVFG